MTDYFETYTIDSYKRMYRSFVPVPINVIQPDYDLTVDTHKVMAGVCYYTQVYGMTGKTWNGGRVATDAMLDNALVVTMEYTLLPTPTPPPSHLSTRFTEWFTLAEKCLNMLKEWNDNLGLLDRYAIHITSIDGHNPSPATNFEHIHIPTTHGIILGSKYLESES